MVLLCVFNNHFGYLCVSLDVIALFRKFSLVYIALFLERGLENLQ